MKVLLSWGDLEMYSERSYSARHQNMYSDEDRVLRPKDDDRTSENEEEGAAVDSMADSDTNIGADKEPQDSGSIRYGKRTSNAVEPSRKRSRN